MLENLGVYKILNVCNVKLLYRHLNEFGKTFIAVVVVIFFLNWVMAKGNAFGFQPRKKHLKKTEL